MKTHSDEAALGCGGRWVGRGRLESSQGVLRVANALGENVEKGNFIFRTFGLRDLEQVLWTENCWRRNR